MLKIQDMPKLESPFEREEINGQYVCIPKFKREFAWILNKELVNAQEKFDGTNVSVVIQDGKIIKILNRTNLIDIWKSKEWFYNGIRRAMDEGKFKPDFLMDGQYFGELIGPKINGNFHELTQPIWIPFDYCKDHYYFKFYPKWLDEKKLTPEASDTEIYEAFNELFKELKSLWFRQRRIEKMPEGIVFHNIKTGDMCKLRGDMFSWFQGDRHKANNEKYTDTDLGSSPSLVE